MKRRKGPADLYTAYCIQILQEKPVSGITVRLENHIQARRPGTIRHIINERIQPDREQHIQRSIAAKDCICRYADNICTDGTKMYRNRKDPVV